MKKSWKGVRSLPSFYLLLEELAVKYYFERSKVMEGDKIYEESLKQLEKIQKECTTSSCTINFDKLDSITRCELLQAIGSAVRIRKKAVTAVLTGTNRIC